MLVSGTVFLIHGEKKDASFPTAKIMSRMVFLLGVSGTPPIKRTWLDPKKLMVDGR